MCIRDRTTTIEQSFFGGEKSGKNGTEATTNTMYRGGSDRIVDVYKRQDWERELALLENKSNLRKLHVIRHLGREVKVNGKVMLNLSSNDYLGLAAYLPLRMEFLQSLTPDTRGCPPP